MVRRRFWFVLGGAAIAGSIAAFGVGTAYGRGSAPARPGATSVAGRVTGSPVAIQIRSGTTGRGDPNRPAPIAGAIESVSGNSITIHTARGETMTFTVGADTRILTPATGSIAELQPGANVAIAGQPNGSGSLSATEVQVQPPDGIPLAIPVEVSSPSQPGTPPTGGQGGPGNVVIVGGPPPGAP